MPLKILIFGVSVKPKSFIKPNGLPKNIESIRKKLNKEDGLKIEMDGDWVHLRASNTEPIIRIYSESSTKTTAENINRKIMDDIRVIMK